MQKLDQFKGKIDFQNDNPAKIQQTLKSLRDYLASYEEADASIIVSDFYKTVDGKPEASKVEQQRHLMLYHKRTEVLNDLNKTFKKIEQNQKKKPLRAQTVSRGWRTGFTKAGAGLGAVTAIAGKAKDTAVSFMDVFKHMIKGALLGKLLGLLTAPLLALATKLLKGLILKPAKWLLKGIFKLAKNAVKLALKGALAVGGLAWKGLKGLSAKIWDSDIMKKLRGATAGILGKIKSVGSAVLDSVKGLGSKLAGFAQSAMSRMKDMAGSAMKFASDVFGRAKDAMSGIAESFAKPKPSGKGWFGSAWDSVKRGAGTAWSATKQAAGAAWDATKSAASAAWNTAKSGMNKIAGFMGKKWQALKTKLENVVKKLVSPLSKTGGIGAKIALKLPVALGRALGKFVPGLGLALLAYDVYSAAKKSNGVVSFTVNFIDELSGGLLSLAAGFKLGEEAGNNLGEYVSDLIRGANAMEQFAGDDMLEGLEIDKMNLDSDPVMKMLQQVQNVQFSGTASEAKTIQNHLDATGNPHREAVLRQYKSLSDAVKAGKITPQQARLQFKSFVERSIVQESNIENFEVQNFETVKHPDFSVEDFAIEAQQQQLEQEVLTNHAIDSALYGASLMQKVQTAQIMQIQQHKDKQNAYEKYFVSKEMVLQG